MKITLNDYQKILCTALSSGPYEARAEKMTKLLPRVDDELLYSMAKTDEVDSHLGWLMEKAGLDTGEKFKRAAGTVAERISALMDELDRVARYFDQYDIKVVALKNAGIARGIYPVPACSPMGDIDLLVSGADFHEAHHVLTGELGYTFQFRSELEDEDLEKAFRNGGTEYYRDVNGQNIWLELQHRPVSGRWIQPHLEPDGDQLLANSIRVPGSKVHILSPVDNLLQVCLHTAKHSYCRSPGFRLHSDVDRIVRHTEVNWEKFTDRVKDLNLCTAVSFSLYFAKELLETPIPGHVIGELKPSKLKQTVILRFINKAGLYNQNGKKFTKMGYILFNMLMFDSLSDLFKGIVPSPGFLKEKYGFESTLLIPYFYVKRLFDLAFRRSNL